MIYEFYAAAVALAAILYSAATRFIQNKLIDKKQMQEIQEESKRLSKEQDEASKRKDQKKLDELMQRQLELFPKMNGMMMGQFKVMGVILIVLFGFSWLVNTFNPALEDDINIILSDSGQGCDAKAGDSIFSACYPLQAASNASTWAIDAKAYGPGLLGEDVTAENYTLFAFNSPTVEKNAYYKAPKGVMGVALDKEAYYAGDQLRVFASAPKGTTKVTATLNSGTTFYVDLPFTIPVINVQRIHEPYWWFIFVVFIFGIVISILQKPLEKIFSKKESKA
jgi:uncharacterized membrane protein (DUF106 family)